MRAIDAIDRIRWYRDLPEAHPGMPWDKEFEDRAYIRWACDELMLDLMDCLDISAETTIDTFWLRMEQYCHYATSPKMRKIFKISMDTADTIRAMI